MKREDEKGKDKKNHKPYEKPIMTKYKKISEWIRSGTNPIGNPVSQGGGG